MDAWVYSCIFLEICMLYQLRPKLICIVAFGCSVRGVGERRHDETLVILANYYEL